MGRRVFVGSVVAGFPLLAVTRGPLAAQGRGVTAHTHPENEKVDPVLDHIARQLVAHHNAMRREPRGEHLRAFAAQLRTLTVYGHQIGLDDEVKARTAALVEKEGRYNVLYLEPDRDHLRSELRAYGAQLDEQALNAPITLDYNARLATLDSLLQSGVSARWERLAAIFERVAPDVDRRSGTVVRVSRQTEADYWAGFCKQLSSEVSEVAFMTKILCPPAMIPVVGVAFAPLCIAHMIALAMLGFVYGVYCWNPTF